MKYKTHFLNVGIQIELLKNRRTLEKKPSTLKKIQIEIEMKTRVRNIRARAVFLYKFDRDIFPTAFLPNVRNPCFETSISRRSNPTANRNFIEQKQIQKKKPSKCSGKFDVNFEKSV